MSWYSTSMGSVPTQLVASVAPSSNPPALVSSFDINQDTLQDDQVAAALYQWILETTGKDQRLLHLIVHSKAAALWKQRDTTIYHMYWRDGYICLYFQDFNKAVEFRTEDEMWEEVLRDADEGALWAECVALHARDVVGFAYLQLGSAIRLGLVSLGL
ncbi:hypothetical protein H072_1534 [Dactylellina haptotyla CBS 200.50]|uniref:Uncharacterized protein n=1 Tax=Dactylellina haptotyla (strain CBS 200.50) TaxID=1284197 RepID=S8ANG5_DACHA|nr:hypothetical protein H072_1534 [Dactylellina haptotyla CBS 200.50]